MSLTISVPGTINISISITTGFQRNRGWGKTASRWWHSAWWVCEITIVVYFRLSKYAQYALYTAITRTCKWSLTYGARGGVLSYKNTAGWRRRVFCQALLYNAILTLPNDPDRNRAVPKLMEVSGNSRIVPWVMNFLYSLWVNEISVQ